MESTPTLPQRLDFDDCVARILNDRENEAKEDARKRVPEYVCFQRDITEQVLIKANESFALVLKEEPKLRKHFERPGTKLYTYSESGHPKEYGVVLLSEKIPRTERSKTVMIAWQPGGAHRIGVFEIEECKNSMTPLDYIDGELMKDLDRVFWSDDTILMASIEAFGLPASQ